MTVIEQSAYKSKSYKEAMRYINNAVDTLKKAKKENGRYTDIKYVKTACGTAYSAVLLALDAYLTLKDIKKPDKNRISIDYYKENLTKLDKKLLTILHDVYEILHLSGYYDGIYDAEIIKKGFDNAKIIIDKIKPDSISKN